MSTVPTQPLTRISVFRACNKRYFTDRDMFAALWGKSSPKLIPDSPTLLQVSPGNAGIEPFYLSNFRLYGRKWYTNAVPDKHLRIQSYIRLAAEAERYAQPLMHHSPTCQLCSKPFRRTANRIRYHHYGVPINWMNGTYICALLCTHLGPDNPYYFFTCTCVIGHRSGSWDMVCFDRLPAGDSLDQTTTCRRCGKEWHYEELYDHGVQAQVYSFPNAHPPVLVPGSSTE